MAGLLIMTLAMMPIGLSSNLQQLFTLICVFYMGSIIAEPARETLGGAGGCQSAAAIWALAG
jgi:DHA1 family multidrug resistance protein-like MFS transporter